MRQPPIRNENDTHRIELFSTPVRPAINPWFINKTDVGTISDPNTSREPEAPHLPTQKLAAGDSRPGEMVSSDVSKGADDTVHVVVCRTLCDAHNTGGFNPRYCAGTTQEGCQLELYRPLRFDAGRDEDRIPRDKIVEVPKSVSINPTQIVSGALQSRVLIRTS